MDCPGPFYPPRSHHTGNGILIGWIVPKALAKGEGPEPTRASQASSRCQNPKEEETAEQIALRSCHQKKKKKDQGCRLKSNNCHPVVKRMPETIDAFG